MSKQVLVLNATDLTAASFAANYDLASGRLERIQGLENYLAALKSGNQSGTGTLNVGAVASDGYIRVATGGSTAAQAMTLLNVTLTARNSAPATNEFVVSATAATQATNMAAAINASASFTGKVTALASGGDVLLFAVVPGASGNGLQVSAGNLSNVTVPKPFAGGSEGTAYTF